MVENVEYSYGQCKVVTEKWTEESNIVVTWEGKRKSAIDSRMSEKQRCIAMNDKTDERFNAAERK